MEGSIRFNPTATALYHDGTNTDQVREELKRLTGKAYSPGLQNNTFYVVFMGDVRTMSHEQFRAAQGLI